MRTARLLATAVLAATTLTGCEGDGGPEPSPLPAQSVSPTAAPVLPDEALDPGVPAAEAFADHYFAVFNHASETGTTLELESLHEKSCTSCSAIVDRIQQLYGSGGRIESEGWQIESVGHASKGPNQTVVFDLNVFLPQELEFQGPTTTPETHAATKRVMRLTVHFGDKHWLVQRLEVLS